MEASHWKIKNTEEISPDDTFMHGRYRIVRKVGSGGQGAAYLVKDTELNVE
jgi:hypothetical protein